MGIRGWRAVFLIWLLIGGIPFGFSDPVVDCASNPGLSELHPERAGSSECRERSIRNRGIGLSFSVIGAHELSSRSEMRRWEFYEPHRLLLAYIYLQRVVSPAPCFPPAANANSTLATEYFQCFNPVAAESYRNFSEFLNPRGESASPEHTRNLRLWLQERVAAYPWTSIDVHHHLGTVTENDLALLRAYHDLVNTAEGATTPQAIQAEFERRMRRYQSLSIEDKLTLARLVGLRFKMNYDQSRYNQLGSARGAVQPSELLSVAYRNSVYHSYPDYDDFRNPETQVAGVCRDIASMQAMMLRIWGFPNTYVVSFARADGAYHVNVVAQDPRTPRRNYFFDYEFMNTDGNRQGAAILNQGPMDVALNYRVYDPAGGGRANVVSPFGAFMMDVSGSGASRVEPLAPPLHSIVRGNVRVQGTSSGVFYGTDAAGATYVGVNTRYLYGIGGDLPGSLGASIGTRNTLIPNEGGNLNLDFLYLQWEQDIRFAEFALGEGVIGVIETQATTFFMGARARGDVADGEFSAQSDLRLQPQIRVDAGNPWRDANFLRLIMGIQFSPGIGDIRDNQFPQVPVPVLHHLLLSVEGRRQLARSGAGRAYLLAATRVLVDQFGARGQAEMGLIIGDPNIAEMGARVGVTGRLSETEPLWQPGALRAVDGSITANIPPHFQVGATLRRTVEGGPEPEITTVTGTLTVTLDPVRRR